MDLQFTTSLLAKPSLANTGNYGSGCTGCGWCASLESGWKNDCGV